MKPDSQTAGRYQNLIAIIAVAVLIVFITACSSRQGYEALQGMEQSRCAHGPANQYRECLDRQQMSYEEYQAKANEQEDAKP